MSDYGHELAFGTFISPAAGPPESAVRLAQLSERAGYDLVTFQDHPYQPAFLDTWTLLTWVAARTERIQIAPNVLNVPLRPPAVLARAAASLDLLSDGRLNLALGAGGFWDAIEAMGTPRKNPREAVDALSEAIDVIRGIWDVDNRKPLRIVGEHYHLDGAKRGPEPAHDIPIWLGAYKPRMLQLIGRKADGWLPSLPYLKPGDLARGNAIIDEAAAAAGRDPRAIRRVLNIFGQSAGPSDEWVEQLLPLILEDGVGTIVLGSDDPSTLERFAAEVLPALREAVTRERPGAEDALPASLAAKAITPSSPDYRRFRSTYMRGGSPGLILPVRSTAEVADALAYARSHQDMPLAIRSGGHGISGRSTNKGGIVVDLRHLDKIEVIDPAARRVRIGAGARWKDVAAELGRHGWALTSGDHGGVGVGGLATAGGIGWFAREHGLTIDHMTAAEIVLADGSLVRASEEQNSDLFWAIRGAGANFGVVTSFEFEVDELGHDIGWAQFVLDAGDPAGLLHSWAMAVENAPRDLTASLILGAARPGQPAAAHVLAVVDSDDPDTIISRLQPLADVAPLYDQAVQLASYPALMKMFVPEGDHHGQGEPHARSGLLDHVTPDAADAAAKMLATGEVFFFQVRSMGGATADVAPDATAFAHRSANFSVTAFGADDMALDTAWADIRGQLNGMYLSFETGLDRVEDAFPERTLTRLRELKRRYDPANTFRDNFNIKPNS
ncbi:MAG: LLM class flavin-dependent oxidoreductase [Kibdelosporangium sp.]